ncbi:hypothetical protein [Flavihumibacter solisilvae]|uniref:Uncharacterized protein n=1 Tax=Flavihumibacter solisilvae TaxID=1349421 RepID=A0A0C1LG96_9BACT|nr:hypothetical protein [Flavihumibacter solisilvae]KIC94378.1 hypothetical protein OI18_12215 [Flavihumibacter solisilvae]
MQISVKKVLFEIPHIQLAQLESDEYCLIVEDTELNDLVEDFLWDEYVYESTFVSSEGRDKPAIYFNTFGAGLPVEGLIERLRAINQVEVESIFRKNN